MTARPPAWLLRNSRLGRLIGRFRKKTIKQRRGSASDLVLEPHPNDGRAMNPELGSQPSVIDAEDFLRLDDPVFDPAPGSALRHGPQSAYCTSPVKCPLHSENRQNGAMSTISDRLRQARERAGYDGPGEAAAALGVSRFTYTQHENGIRGFKRESAVKYANKFKVSLEWLLTGKGGAQRKPKVPVICYIGAGAEMHPIDDHPQGQGIEEVEPPQGIIDCVAGVIRGDSMYPLRDGWLIFWARDQAGVPEECLGQLCVVEIQDGPTLVKEVHAGSKRGLYTLQSWNAPPRKDVKLAWAALVIDIRPR